MEDREQNLQCAAQAGFVSGDRRAGPSFWKTQAAVWAIYLVMIYTTFLPMAGEGMLKLLLVIKGLIELLS